MKHLTVDEILDFVSLTELDARSIELSAVVNGHIGKCEKCLELVRSFQMIYDEFVRLNVSGNFKCFLADNISEIKKENNQSVEVADALDEIDILR